MHQGEVDRQLHDMKEKDRYKNDEEKVRKVEALLLKKLEEEKMAFKGDFEKLDDEIRVQVKALG